MFCSWLCSTVAQGSLASIQVEVRCPGTKWWTIPIDRFSTIWGYTLTQLLLHATMMLATVLHGKMIKNLNLMYNISSMQMTLGLVGYLSRVICSLLRREATSKLSLQVATAARQQQIIHSLPQHTNLFSTERQHSGHGFTVYKETK